jgi:hypothetical protein
MHMPIRQRRLPTGLSSELLVAASKETWAETFTQPKRLSSTHTSSLRGLCPARARKWYPHASALRLCSPPLRSKGWAIPLHLRLLPPAFARRHSGISRKCLPQKAL